MACAKEKEAEYSFDSMQEHRNELDSYCIHKSHS